MTRMRPILAVVLALMLGVTSLTLAVARGQGPVAGSIEICAGFSVTTISVDADGQPVHGHHLCPDGVQAFVSADGFAVQPKLRQLADGEDLSLPRVLVRIGAQPPEASARGPPSLA